MAGLNTSSPFHAGRETERAELNDALESISPALGSDPDPRWSVLDPAALNAGGHRLGRLCV